MTDETNQKRYPKSLTAPVDQETWEWFAAEAEAKDRTIGAHLRRVIRGYRINTENRIVATGFATAVDRQIPVVRSDGRLTPAGKTHIDDWVEPDDPEEGVE